MKTKAALLTDGFEANRAGQEQQAFTEESARCRAGSSPAPLPPLRQVPVWTRWDEVTPCPHPQQPHASAPARIDRTGGKAPALHRSVTRSTEATSG